MYDFLMADNICYGVMAQMADGSKEKITADYTMLACGGLGGIYKHSTNYRHITGDALAIAKNHGIRLEHIDYIQIHPTTLYSEKPGRRFLISESVTDIECSPVSKTWTIFSSVIFFIFGQH